MAKSVVSQAIADACFLILVGKAELVPKKNTREIRNEAKEILVGKTGMKNKDFTREKQNRRKRVKCQTG